MKRRTLVLTVVAGLVVFLGVLVFYLPASWFSSALPAQVQCGALGGSIWRGECVGLQVQGNALGDATWNLAPGKAFSGRLEGDLDVRGAVLGVRADLNLAFNGSGELRNVSARFPLDPAFLAQLPRNQRGNVVADLKRVVLSEGPAINLLQGVIELRDFRQVGARPLDLGSYQLTFDGSTSPNGNVVGQLRDLGGPFAVTGSVTLSAPRTYLVEGYITGRTAAAERLVREITLGAPPEVSGRSPFSFEGSY